MSMIALTEPGGANEIVVSADDALALSERVMRRAGYSEDESRIIAANLLDAELCGYPALGLARLITIAEDPRTRQHGRRRHVPTDRVQQAAQPQPDGGRRC